MGPESKSPMVKRLVKISAGILLLPVAAAASISFYRQLGQINQLSKNQTTFLLGAVVYLIVHVLLFKPKYIYVLGHELTHAIATWILGGRVLRFRASSKGGSLQTTKYNFFVGLAPYMFPIYTVFLCGLYFLIDLFYELANLAGYFIFLIGASLAFHIVLTVEFLKAGQSDVSKSGILFSLCLIYIVNLGIIGFFLGLLFPDFSFIIFCQSGIAIAADIYNAIFTQVFL